jgi:hypothetical protein
MQYGNTEAKSEMNRITRAALLATAAVVSLSIASAIARAAP